MSDSYRGTHKSDRLGKIRAGNAAKRGMHDARIATAALARKQEGQSKRNAHNDALAATAAGKRERDAEVVRQHLDEIRVRRYLRDDWRNIARDLGMSVTALQRGYRHILWLEK